MIILNSKLRSVLLSYNDIFDEYELVYDYDEDYLRAWIRVILYLKDSDSLAFLCEEPTIDDSIIMEEIIHFIETNELILPEGNMTVNVIDEKLKSLCNFNETQKASELFSILFEIAIDFKDKNNLMMAFNLLYKLLPVLQDLADNEKIDTSYTDFYPYDSYAFILKKWLGTLCLMSKNLLQSWERLNLLNQRQTVIKKLQEYVPESDASILGNDSSYHFQYAVILESEIGLKKEVLNHYESTISLLNEAKSRGFEWWSIPYIENLSECHYAFFRYWTIKGVHAKATEALKKSIVELQDLAPHFDDFPSIQCKHLELVYLSRVLEYKEFIKKNKIADNDILPIINKAKNHISIVYPIKYSDDTFYTIYQRLQEEVHSEAIDNFEKSYNSIKRKIRKDKKGACLNLKKLANDIEHSAELLDSPYLKNLLGSLYITLCEVLFSFVRMEEYIDSINQYSNRSIELGNIKGFYLKACLGKYLNKEEMILTNLKKGAEYKCPDCCSEYALRLYRNGRIAEGDRFLSIAIEARHPIACMNEAIMVYNGEYGRSQDIKYAYQMMCNVSQLTNVFDEDIKRIEFYIKERMEFGLCTKNLPYYSTLE